MLNIQGEVLGNKPVGMENSLLSLFEFISVRRFQNHFFSQAYFYSSQNSLNSIVSFSGKKRIRKSVSAPHYLA